MRAGAVSRSVQEVLPVVLVLLLTGVPAIGSAAPADSPNLQLESFAASLAALPGQERWAVDALAGTPPLVTPPAPPERDFPLLEAPQRGPRPDGNRTDAPVPTGLGHLPHPPIRITQDAGANGFVLATVPILGVPVYRPGSGVVSGTGTADDPYVIEGWHITTDLFFTALAAIEIRNTRAHVVIRGNFLTSWGTGIEVESAQNVRIEDNTIVSDWDGIRFWNVQDATIVSNQVVEPWGAPVLIHESARILVAENDLHSGAWAGIEVLLSEDIAIGYNTVDAGYFPLYLDASTGIEITGNDLGGGYYGLLVSQATAVHASANRIAGEAGVVVYGGADIVFADNEFSNASWSTLYAIAITGLHVVDNVFTGPEPNIVIYDSAAVVFASNTVHGAGSFASVVLAWIDGLEVAGNELHRMRLTIYEVQALHLSDNEVHGGWAGVTLGVAPDAVVSGNTLTGFEGIGILAYASPGLAVHANTLTSLPGAWGIYIQQSDGATVTGNHLTGPASYGLFLALLAGAVAHGNIFDGPMTALYSFDTPGVLFTGNKVRALGGTQTVFNYSPGATVLDNTFTSGPPVLPPPVPFHAQDVVTLRASGGGSVKGNSFHAGGFAPFGESRSAFLFDMDASNTIGGRPVVYLRDAPGATVPAQSGQVILVGSHGVNVDGASFEDAAIGVLIAHSDGVQVTASSFSASQIGVFLVAADDAEVAGNAFAGAAVGVVLYDSVGSLVADNGFETTQIGVAAGLTHGLAVAGNTFSGGTAGVYLLQSFGASIAGNEATGQFYAGIALDFVRDVQVTGNRVADAASAGILVDASRKVHLAHNDIEGATYGIDIVDSATTTATKNEITENWWGIRIAGPENGGGHVLSGNNIVGNQLGVTAPLDLQTDARGNWWGCADGPGAPGCNSALGNLLIAPWETEPVADAGAP